MRPLCNIFNANINNRLQPQQPIQVHINDIPPFVDPYLLSNLESRSQKYLDSTSEENPSIKKLMKQKSEDTLHTTIQVLRKYNQSAQLQEAEVELLHDRYKFTVAADLSYLNNFTANSYINSMLVLLLNIAHHKDTSLYQSARHIFQGLKNNNKELLDAGLRAVIGSLNSKRTFKVIESRRTELAITQFLSRKRLV